MKCLSLWQPWASAVAIGKKQVETRSWSTNYRGPLLIHAAKTVDGLLSAVQDRNAVELWRRVLGVPDGEMLSSAFNRLPYGSLIARTEILHVVPMGKECLSSDGDERALGNYEDGRFAWFLGRVEILPRMIPFRGHQGLFEVPDEVLR